MNPYSINKVQSYIKESVCKRKLPINVGSFAKKYLSLHYELD